MSEPITISLDGGVPTEPGFYFVNWAPPEYSDSWQFVRVGMLHGELCAFRQGDLYATKVSTPARWSRRLIIDTARAGEGEK